jgi:hypothetical protein
MEYIEIKTLIDITQTNVRRDSDELNIAFNQHKNFITLLQCLEIKSIINYDFGPTVETVDIKDLGFGSLYKGKNSVWTFKFSPDRAGVYKSSDNNEIGLLPNDIHQVPIIKKLTETINIDIPIFDCHDPKLKNIIFKIY